MTTRTHTCRTGACAACRLSAWKQFDRARSCVRALGCAFALMLAASATQAVPLTLWQSTNLPGTSYAEDPTLNGTVVAADIQSFNYNALGMFVSGYVYTSVVKRNDTGTLDFHWWINRQDGRLDIDFLAIIGFDSPAIDADFLDEPYGDVKAFSAYWVPNELGFYFADMLKEDLDSKWMYARTTATDWTNGSLELRTQDCDNGCGIAGTSGPLHTFVPGTSHVPEPTSLGLMLAAIGALVAVRWRRR